MGTTFRKYKNTVKSQLFMMVRKYSFWCSFGIMMLYTLYVFFFFLAAYYKHDVIAVYSGESFYAGRLDSTLRWQGMFLNLLPLIITITFSFTFFEEKKSGVIQYLFVRVGPTCYYVSKMIVAFIANFIIVVVPYLWSLLLNRIMYPDTTLTIDGDSVTTMYYNFLLKGNKIPFSVFFIKHTFLYLVLFTIWLGILIGLLGVFSYAVSLYIKRYKVFIFLPLIVLYYVMNHYPNNFRGLSMNVMMLLENGWKREFRYLVPLFLVALLTTSLVLVGVKCMRSKGIEEL